MERFKNILIVMDSSGKNDPIAHRAVDLARRNGARLTFVAVVKELPSELQWTRTKIDVAKLQESVIDDRLGSLEKLIEPHREAGTELIPKVLVGSPFLEIIREVLRNGHDLVLKSAAGEALRKTWLFGSTDMHLFRKCPCPVWIFKPTPPKKIGRILAAVDPHPYDKDKTALSLKIMELATSLAKQEGSQLHVVHAMVPYTEKVLRSSRSGFHSDMADRLLREIEEEHEKVVRDLMGQFALEEVAYVRHLMKGEPGEVIPKLAEENNIDLVIMGTVGRTGVAGLLMGNTAEKVLQQVDCSVLAVKPDGYESPVKPE